MNLRFFSLIIAVLIPSVYSDAFAQGFFGGGSYSRRGSSENVRWTLADWLAQKKQFKLMDQWLALNTQKNWVEIGLEGGKIDYELTAGGTTEDHEIERYSASLYVSIFGISAGVEKSDEKQESSWGQFNVRMFGQSAQSTNLVLSYGVRKWEDTVNNLEISSQQYGAGSLQIYIVDFLGVDGTYRKSFNATDNQNNSYEGERVEYGVFLEWQFIRLYGRQWIDKTYKTTAGVAETQTRDGADAGVKFYF